MQEQQISPHTTLERLAAVLDAEQYESRLVTPSGGAPYLRVRNRHANVLSEDIRAGRGVFWFSWSQPIAPVECPSVAAEKIAHVLRLEGATW